MFFMFNSGQAVDEKLNVINAADAAAYSAGVMQARTLNYEAYLNRAIIANELAIAQAVSMVSWTQYFQTAVTDVWGIDAFIAGSGLLLGCDGARAALLAAALAGTAYANAESGGAVLAQSVNYVRQANELIVPAHAAAIIALRASQRAIDVAMSSGTLQRNLAQEIARGTDRTLSVELVPGTIPGLASFTRSYGRDSGPPGGVGDERGRLAGAVMRSRDAFTADRSFTLHGANIFPWLRDVTLKKRGGTDLVSFDEWQAMDTLSGHARLRRCGFFGSAFCPDIELPFAGGGADLRAAQAGAGARGYLGGAWAENPKAAEMTEDYWTTRVATRGWRGISDNQDLADLDMRPRGSPAATPTCVRAVPWTCSTRMRRRVASARSRARKFSSAGRSGAVTVRANCRACIARTGRCGWSHRMRPTARTRRCARTT